MDQRLGSSSEDVLKKPVRGGRAFTTQQRAAVDFSSTIKGWGSDLDPAVRPGVPRDKAPDIGTEDLYLKNVTPQLPTHKIHKSTEHARLTPVFGTSCPPKGWSGEIRDYAYTLSEGKLGRWLLLMFADRVDMIEGIISDISQSRFPNIPKEMGLKAELKHNKKAVARNVLIAGAVIYAFMAYRRMKKRS